MIAVTAGAFIGAMVGLNLSEVLTYGIIGLPVGMVVGGLVGYVVYDFKTVVSAVPIAWEKTCLIAQWRPPKIDWQKVKLAWRFACAEGIRFFTLVITFAWPLLFLVYLGGSVSFLRASLVVVLVTLSVFMTLVVMMFLLLCIFFIGCGVSKEELMLSCEEACQKSRHVMRYWNPVVVCVYWVPVGIYTFICLYVWPMLLFVLYFAGCMFYEVHDDIRLLCMVDGAIFAGVGWCTGGAISAVVAAVIGGLFGLLNYHVVSIRVLKLEPRGV